MGIHGIYQEIGRGERVALSKLAVEKFEQTGRPFRIAIDVSIWLFQIQAGKGGTNPAPRTFYYRLLRLISLCINPIFVFDGPNKPPFKRGKRTGANVSSVPDFLAKQLIKQFGFPIHYAPGEAEAECALLQREGIVDAVLSEDVDTMMFGSGMTIRNWSPELKSSKTPTHVNVYDAVKTKNGPSGLDRDGMILVALMSGGDYVPEGIPGCGPKTACEAARAGFGRDLCKIKKTDRMAMREWRERLQHELKTNESKYFKRKHGTLKIPDDFPRHDILGYYTHPVVSNQAGLGALRRAMKWDHEIDFAGLRSFTHDAFDWIRLEGAKHFIRSLAPSLLVRALRMRAENERFTPDDPEAIREDEAQLVKAIHGMRQHAVTDGTTELRVSFTPIELVKIDLSKEEPDEFLEELPILASQADNAGEVDMEAIEIEEDDDAGSKKRAPTKFDPVKPARIWVLETFVKVGVPLTTEDWEAGLRRPKRAATVRQTSKAAPKATGARRAKATGNTPQSSIEQFAKVTKPRAKTAQTLSKASTSSREPSIASQQVTTATTMVLDLLSPSPTKISSTILRRSPREKSLSSVQEDLPPSVTKRRRRAPNHRSNILPADLNSAQDRPTTPPLLDTIETLDLVSSPVLASPSHLPAKKAKTRTRDPLVVGPTRHKSVTASPSKNKQTTLDVWSRSSPAVTPTRLRNTALPASTVPLPAPPQFQTSKDAIKILDLTHSSPTHPPSLAKHTQPLHPHSPRRGSASTSELRLPLQSISPNATFRSSTSNSFTARPTTKAAKATHSTGRTSPPLQKTTSSEINTLDLTELSSSPPTTFTQPATPPLAAQPKSRIASASLSPTPQSDQFTRRSPRNHAGSSPPPKPSSRGSASPPAPWQERKQKKRHIVLRKSLAGAWDYAEASGTPSIAGGKIEILKGKERRKWRESEIQILDMVD